MSPTARARALDKFYTRPDIAALCVDDFERWTGLRLFCAPHTIIEPSAGNGAFLGSLPAHTQAYDLLPEDPRIQIADFFALSITGPAIVIGNPPFGRMSSLAVRFFNHAAGFADHIGFILPRSFEKDSVIRRLDRTFALVGQRVLPPNSFVFGGKPYTVPCCFQAWSRTPHLRSVAQGPIAHPDFVFADRSVAHFALQRVGARAGLLKFDFARVADSSHHFVRATHDPMELAGRLQRLDLAALAARTAGNPSLSKREIVAAYAGAL